MKCCRVHVFNVYISCMYIYIYISLHMSLDSDINMRVLMAWKDWLASINSIEIPRLDL